MGLRLTRTHTSHVITVPFSTALMGFVSNPSPLLQQTPLPPVTDFTESLTPPPPPPVTEPRLIMESFSSRPPPPPSFYDRNPPPPPPPSVTDLASPWSPSTPRQPLQSSASSWSRSVDPPPLHPHKRNKQPARVHIATAQPLQNHFLRYCGQGVEQQSRVQTPDIG